MTRAAAEACLRNIGPERIARRRRVALGAAAVAVLALAVLAILDLPHRWRALLVIPHWVAALAWMQAAAGT